jgi:DNA-binding transcriptional ArsR family regulator
MNHENDNACGPHEHAPHAHEPVADAVLARAAELCAALGDPSRLRLLTLLASGEHCVSELAAETGATLPAVSQRLSRLDRAGWVRRARAGKHVRYTLADEHVRQIVAQILLHAAEPLEEP